MADLTKAGVASGRQRSLATFFAACFLGLALFFLIVGVSKQHSAMLAGSAALAVAGLSMILVVLRLRKNASMAGELVDAEDSDSDGEELVDEQDDAAESELDECGVDEAEIAEIQGSSARPTNNDLAYTRKPGQLPEPRPRKEDRLFEHKTNDLRDAVNYRR